METINYIKSFSYEARVFVDGQATGETRMRTKALFMRTVSLFDGLSTTKQFGTLLMTDGVTAEEAEAYFDKDVDYSDVLKFKSIEGSDFYLVTGK